MEILNEWIGAINEVLWSYVLIIMLLGCAFWFTLRGKFVQFRMIGERVRLLGDSTQKADGGEKHISSFQAFAVSLASRVGTGNLAGVATAVALDGRLNGVQLTQAALSSEVGGMVLFSALASLDLAWSLADVTMRLITICNLIAIALLSKQAFRLLQDYVQQKRNGMKSPVFTRNRIPELRDTAECCKNRHFRRSKRGFIERMNPFVGKKRVSFETFCGIFSDVLLLPS